MEQEQHEQNVRSFPDSGLAMTTWVSCDGCVPCMWVRGGRPGSRQEVGLERQTKARLSSISYGPDSEITGGFSCK